LIVSTENYGFAWDLSFSSSDEFLAKSSILGRGNKDMELSGDNAIITGLLDQLDRVVFPQHEMYPGWQ